MKFITVFTGLLLSSVMAQSAMATTVAPLGSGSVAHLTDLGMFAAGNYQITGSGVVDLVGDGSFQMRPDGVPNTPVTAANYGYFNPSGSYIADSVFGVAGSNAKIGALIGTLSAHPTSAADWFLIGYSKNLSLASAGHIYAAVNDTYYPNDSGFFTANVTAVPEPESYAMMLAGLGLLATLARRKNRV
ncbi:PEP-CTERM sorting domain-containing protein [Undibacterium sp.]|uniref:PEP-CTERM sorting domain-containing protein n=1 Tax=Undibacterium sp. TaxID=1914977 RepID=UPI0025F96FFE|nr:PEP-CTERM sorting domain-containing protein [Undibacterium sp.]